ncbi:expressed protein [Dictyostelium purpureum]|uniref:Expressed protein n=1 Tax=Dictyostelium purpureum TaxID=5786 RepID=F0ZXR9_DICPU|nr:uncharacterized protein DICPUDRAFT_92821 [Dictyostelium purpureum]EGC31272.1 expressed protein [Dictyostelium purpureum]|eukprot:XP_003292217.1 expressed protein [Dictyostelium purpureum]
MNIKLYICVSFWFLLHIISSYSYPFNELELDKYPKLSYHEYEPNEFSMDNSDGFYGNLKIKGLTEVYGFGSNDCYQNSSKVNVYACQGISVGVSNMEYKAEKHVGWFLVGLRVNHKLEYIDCNTDMAPSISLITSNTQPSTAENSESSKTTINESSETIGIEADADYTFGSGVFGGGIDGSYSKTYKKTFKYQSYIKDWSIINHSHMDTVSDFIFDQSMPWGLRLPGKDEGRNSSNFSSWKDYTTGKVGDDKKLLPLPDLSVSIYNQKLFVPFTIDIKNKAGLNGEFLTSRPCTTVVLKTTITPTVAMIINIGESDSRLYLKTSKHQFSQFIDLDKVNLKTKEDQIKREEKRTIALEKSATTSTKTMNTNQSKARI